MRRQQARVSVPYSVATRLRSQRHRLSVVARTTSAAKHRLRRTTLRPLVPCSRLLPSDAWRSCLLKTDPLLSSWVFLTTALARALARLMLPGPPPAAASAPRETAALGGAG